MIRYRRRRSRRDRRDAALAVVAGLAVAAFAHAGGALGAHAPGAQAPSGAAAQAIAYARAQLGKPYAWGATGPDGYDCSGLVMEAYASAGVTIPRTSQEQWTAGPQVSSPAPGDLVFFAGADGTWTSPGHVGLVVNPAEHLMIDAYGPDGAPISYDTYGLATSRPGLTDPVGFTDPAAPDLTAVITYARVDGRAALADRVPDLSQPRPLAALRVGWAEARGLS
jgi:hypothetical protein